MARPTPLPNRVSPFGTVTALPARGTMMGTRGGRIHEGWEIRRHQASPRWICCVLSFKGRQRRVMGAGYTELFFLDEATALTAGHRPCFECRRADATAFAAAWARAKGMSRPPLANEMDKVLKTERPSKACRPPPVPCPDITALPPGAMVARGEEAYLWTGARALRWGFGGYGAAGPLGDCHHLTPASIRAALGAGYRPGLHPSALAV